MLATLFPAISLPARAATSGDYDYTDNGATCTITRYNGADSDVVVPSSIGGFPVVEIAANAFRSNTSIASVTIPNSVTSIGDNAFRYCNNLQTVAFPANLESIGKYAFADCLPLTSGSIPDNVTFFGEGCFTNCPKLQTVTFGDHVQTIDKMAFQGCASLTSVTIPDSLSALGYQAFNHCTSLSSVFLPNGISLGSLVFNDCSPALEQWKYTVASGSVTIDKYTGTNANVTIPSTIGGKPVTKIADAAFRDRTTMTSVSIPNSVTSIGDNAFRNCTNLSTIAFPSNLQTIGGSAFQSCGNLQNLTLPDSVQTINVYAFKDCALQTITIPANVTSIGDNAFYNAPVTIYGYPNTTAQTYANANSIPFVDLTPVVSTPEPTPEPPVTTPNPPVVSTPEPSVDTTPELVYFNDIMVDSSVKGVQINLSTETLELNGFSVAAYSIDGGAKWKTGKIKLSTILNKENTLWLASKWNKKTKKAEGNIAKFPKISARPKATKTKVQYETNDTFTLTEKDLAVSDKETGLVLFVPRDVTGSKQKITVVTPPINQKGKIQPKSKEKKLTVAALLKAPKAKVDTKKKVIKLKKFEVLTIGTQIYSAESAAKTVKLANVSPGEATLRSLATGKKPGSKPTTFTLPSA